MLDTIINGIFNAVGGAGPSQSAGQPQPAAAATAPPISAATGNDVAPAAAAATPKKLDQGTAKQFLMQAGGDKNKARQLAREAGYVF